MIKKRKTPYLECPHCGRIAITLKERSMASVKLSGNQFTCPHCEKMFEVPRLVCAVQLLASVGIPLVASAVLTELGLLTTGNEKIDVEFLLKNPKYAVELVCMLALAWWIYKKVGCILAYYTELIASYDYGWINHNNEK